MNAESIVRTLRENAEWCDANEYEVPLCMGDNQRAAADLIESLQAQLADYHHMSGLVDGKMKENQRLRRINENLQEWLEASRRREKAAVEDLIECMTEYAYTCKFCRKWNGEDVCPSCKPEWRGPQEVKE